MHHSVRRNNVTLENEPNKPTTILSYSKSAVITRSNNTLVSGLPVIRYNVILYMDVDIDIDIDIEMR